MSAQDRKSPLQGLLAWIAAFALLGRAARWMHPVGDPEGAP